MHIVIVAGFLMNAGLTGYIIGQKNYFSVFAGVWYWIANDMVTVIKASPLSK
ncbi:hypothetical protein [Melghiribacillus thermohalophilus]|uniref:hypothetical protein n=1 Tax=Melghiribacillus thermohalophilus TaxID=1324956 RepID=UPI001404E287|nr:hypothetical protein [Melghiribacillus thermohalophilus]